MKSHSGVRDPAVEAVLESVNSRAMDEAVVDVRVGAFWIAVRTGIAMGMASAMRSEQHVHGSRPIAGAGSLHLQSLAELTSLLRSPSPPEAAVGLAAVNALLSPTVDVLTDEKASVILEQRCSGSRVAMVGHFPFADRLRELSGRLDVFERGGNLTGEHHGEDDMALLLPEADVVAVTATTLLNRTLPSVLRHVSADAFLMMLGPSTPLSASLFDFGFDVLCGTVVDDADAAVRAIEQGAVTSQISGVRRVALWSERHGGDRPG